MKHSKRKPVGIILSTVILAAGFALFFYPDFQMWRQKQQANEILGAFAEYGETDGMENISEDAETDESAESSESAGSEEAGGTGENKEEKAEKNPAAEKTSRLELLRIELENYNQELLEKGQSLVDCWSYEQNPISLEYMPENSDAIGRIRIPDMDVELPLLLGASTENMALGATVLAETSMPIGGTGTNCVIAGHRGYNGLPYFRNIQDLVIGSEVYIDNPWGTMAYIVTGTDVIAPDDLSCLNIQKDKELVTLITCHPYMSGGKFRYVVYCEPAESPAAEEAIKAKESGVYTEFISGGSAAETAGETADGGIDEAEAEAQNEYSERMVQLEIWLRYGIMAAFAIWWLFLILHRNKKDAWRHRT